MGRCVGRERRSHFVARFSLFTLTAHPFRGGACTVERGGGGGTFGPSLFWQRGAPGVRGTKCPIATAQHICIPKFVLVKPLLVIRVLYVRVGRAVGTVRLVAHANRFTLEIVGRRGGREILVGRSLRRIWHPTSYPMP